MKRVYCHETFLVQSILGCKIMTIIPVKHIFCRKKNSSWKHTIYSHLLWYCGQWLTPCSVNHYTYIQFSMSVSPVWKRITLFLFSESKVKQIIPIFSVHPPPKPFYYNVYLLFEASLSPYFNWFVNPPVRLSNLIYYHVLFFPETLASCP